MVEALVQQLAAARAQQSPPAGPAPSELREKLVQTEHTELSQVRTRSGKRLSEGNVEDLELYSLIIIPFGCCNFQLHFNKILLCILCRPQCTETFIWRL